ncbi:MAG: hypothetical protein LQ351_007559 [Letrouitia transgressa]|nr:MAG: hypothetical protein LQ351_007559 [Letrouitia transgressa]
MTNLIAAQEQQKLLVSGEVMEDEYFQKTTLIGAERLARLLQWFNNRKESAEKTLEQIRQTGKAEAADNQSETPMFDITGLSGADILRLCGVKKPFAMQSERKAFGELPTEVCDESDEWETEEEWSNHAGVKSCGQRGKGRKKRLMGKRSRRYTPTDTFDTVLDSLNPFTKDDMFELACQGIKP